MMQSKQSNLRTTTQTELQDIKLNDPVYIQLNWHRSKWIKGTVLEISNENTSGHSYKVQTDIGGVYIRN